MYGGISSCGNYTRTVPEWRCGSSITNLADSCARLEMLTDPNNDNVFCTRHRFSGEK